MTSKEKPHLKALALGIALSLGLGFAATAGAADAKTEIKLGNTVPYSGPASFYGIVGQATVAYFAKVNDEGGINGRKVTVISLDDALAPPKTVEQVRRMVEQDKVDAVINQVGTATASAVRKYLNTKKVPQLFVQSGSKNFEQPKEYPYSTAGLINYEFEGKIYGQLILKANPDAKVGILYQNDDYGKDYITGLRVGLGAKAKELKEVSYLQQDPTIDSQILELRQAGVDVIVLAAYSKQVSQAIRKISDLGWKPQIYISHVSTQIEPTLSNAGLANASGAMTVLVSKDPSDPTWKDDPDFLAYLAWMKKYYPSGDPNNSANAASYMASAAVAHVLKQAGDDLSSANILKQVTSLREFAAPMLLPGITMTITPESYNLYPKVQLMRFDGKRWVPQGQPVGDH